MTDQPDFTRLRRERILQVSGPGDADELHRSAHDAPRPSTEEDAARPEPPEPEATTVADPIAGDDGPQRPERNADLDAEQDVRDEPVDPADEDTSNDSGRARTPRGQRVMLREIEEDEGRAENLLADTPPDADHAPDARDLALTWAAQSPSPAAAPLQRTASTIEGQVAADEAEITPLEAERMGLARSQRLSHEPAHQPTTPTPDLER